jgi:hypothetical protein
LARTIARKAVSIQGLLPRPPRGAKTCVIFPRLSQAADKIFVEKELLNEKRFLSARVPGKTDIRIVPLDPEPKDIQGSVNAARRADRTVFFCNEAHMMPGCRALLDNLQKTVRNLVVVLMRTPYDRALLRPAVPTVTAFGYRRCQIEACLEKIFPRL